MSRGYGVVQRAIFELINSDADGVFTTSDIIHRAYSGINRIEKKHRVAALRAMRRTALPDGWWFYDMHCKNGQAVIYNAYSDEAAIRMEYIEYASGSFYSWNERYSFEKWRQQYPHKVAGGIEWAKKRREWRDASEIQRCDIEIQRIQNTMGLLGIAVAHGNRGAASKSLDSCMSELRRLEARKKELSVSFPSS